MAAGLFAAAGSGLRRIVTTRLFRSLTGVRTYASTFAKLASDSAAFNCRHVIHNQFVTPLVEIFQLFF